MPKRTYFLKDDETLEKLKTILDDKNFSISKYWIKQSYIIEKLEKNQKFSFHQLIGFWQSIMIIIKLIINLIIFLKHINNKYSTIIYANTRPLRHSLRTP